MFRVSFFFLAATLIGCIPCPTDECTDYCGRTMLQLRDADGLYDVKPDAELESGIKIDTTQQSLDLVGIEKKVEEVEQCLLKNFPDGTLPKEIRAVAGCYVLYFPVPLKKKCLTIKVTDEYQFSETSNTQTLLDLAPPHLCRAKGQVPTEANPCRWRVLLQDRSTTIIVPPDMALLKDGLIRVFTGCNNPWAHPLLSECAS